MLSATDAIALVLHPLNDRAQLLYAYTRTGGRVTYKVYGLGRRHAAGLYAPLSLLQLTTDESSVRTAQLAFVPRTIPVDPYKRSIALFMSEVLSLTLRHPMSDEPMFDYICDVVRRLDETNEPQNSHLQFMVGLAEKLGFAIDPAEHPELYATPLTRAARQHQLRSLCMYFSEHIDDWQEPRSLDILMEIFD